MQLNQPQALILNHYKVAIAVGDTCKQLGQELLARYYKINKIQRQPLPLKLFSAATSQAMPDGDYKPILGKYPGIFQTRRMATGKGLYETLGMWRSPLEKYFVIPKGYKLVCGPALGYPKEDEKVNLYRPQKLRLDELIMSKK